MQFSHFCHFYNFYNISISNKLVSIFSTFHLEFLPTLFYSTLDNISDDLPMVHDHSSQSTPKCRLLIVIT